MKRIMSVKRMLVIKKMKRMNQTTIKVKRMSMMMKTVSSMDQSPKMMTKMKMMGDVDKINSINSHKNKARR